MQVKLATSAKKTSLPDKTIVDQAAGPPQLGRRAQRHERASIPVGLLPDPPDKSGESDAQVDAARDLISQAISKAFACNLQLAACLKESGAQDNLTQSRVSQRRSIVVDLARMAFVQENLGQSPELAEELPRRQDNLHRLILKEFDSPVTGLAMVLSALRAGKLRGVEHGGEVYTKLFAFALQQVPEQKRLEALVAFRSMLGPDQANPMVEECNAQIKKRYVSLNAEGKSLRLHEWSRMSWWREEIGQFAGHTEPVRLWAVAGMTAILGPRLAAQNQKSSQHCLANLMERIYPTEGETLVTAQWQPCIDAWCGAVVKAGEASFQGLMLDLLWPVVHDPGDAWPPHAQILLMAMRKCLSLFSQADQIAGEQLSHKMGHWFGILTPRVLRLHATNAGQALTLALQIIRIIQPVNHEWARLMQEHLREVMNSEPDNSLVKSTRNFDPNECKTQ